MLSYVRNGVIRHTSKKESYMEKISKKTIIIIVAILSVVPHFTYSWRAGGGGGGIRDFYLRSPIILLVLFAVTALACICLWLIVNYCPYREVILAICGSILFIPGLAVFIMSLRGMFDHLDYDIWVAFAAIMSLSLGVGLLWMAICYARARKKKSREL